ncbi:MAG: Coq4 family protein [Actinomycetota bacterium]
MTEPIVDRAFAEKFLTAVDRPFDYGVYLLFHDWWEEAPQDAIDAYHQELLSIPGAGEFVDRRFLAEPLAVADLERCAPGTLGDGYRRFIVDNGLEENLARNYRSFNEQLQSSGTLDRLPDDLSYAIVRGFQIHDFLHVMTGFSSKPLGELAQAGFHFAQLRFPYHAMRVAVTTAHLAFVSPGSTTKAMDALVDGWVLGRASDNLHFHLWEDELDTPLDELRERFGVSAPRLAVA